MQLESLKIFCDVVRLGSFSKGAHENGVSQPAASQAVQQIEHRLGGITLIDRTRRPLLLTEAGKLYYEGCQELIERYFEVENSVKAMQNVASVTGTVRVAAIYSVGVHHLSHFVNEFKKVYAKSHVRLQYLHPDEVLDVVSRGDVDFGLISYPRKWPDLVVIPWRDEEMALAVPPNHSLARRPTVSLLELDQQRFVHFDLDLSIRKAIDKFLRKNDIHIEVTLEFDNIENIKRAVEAGSGVAILPLATFSQEVSAGMLAAVRFRDAAISRPVAIIHRRSPSLNMPAARFLEFLIREGGATTAAASPPTRSYAAALGAC